MQLGTQMTGRSKALRWPMVKTAGPLRRCCLRDGVRVYQVPILFVHPISWQTLQLVPPCSPTPKRQMAPTLSPGQKSRMSEPSYPVPFPGRTPSLKRSRPCFADSQFCSHSAFMAWRIVDFVVVISVRRAPGSWGGSCSGCAYGP